MKNANVNLTGAIGQMGGDLVVKESGCQGHVTTTKVNSHIIYLSHFNANQQQQQQALFPPFRNITVKTIN